MMMDSATTTLIAKAKIDFIQLFPLFLFMIFVIQLGTFQKYICPDTSYGICHQDHNAEEVLEIEAVFSRAIVRSWEAW